MEQFGNPILGEKDEQLPRLGEVCMLKAGLFVRADDIQSEFGEGLYPCFGGNGLRGYVSDYTHDGDFPIIGRQGALCGNVQYVTGKFHATEHAVVVTAQDSIDSYWLYHLHFWGQADRIAYIKAINDVLSDYIEPIVLEKEETK